MPGAFDRLLGLFGLARKRRLDRTQRELSRLRQACVPFAVAAVEITGGDLAQLLTWKSQHYGCDSDLRLTEIREIGKAFWPDFYFRQLGIAKTAPVYQKWAAEHPKLAAQSSSMPWNGAGAYPPPSQ